ncbi:putative bifunctional diguanylate cyclase/phosphodiesterase [Oceanisphaera sp.]|uniref:bifunctional diguanylate cyclase/phosphodiesterase n=1 Tax=Oceanisphaera sp. TaxID=1929979 RepID=UPI003A94A4A3
MSLLELSTVDFKRYLHYAANQLPQLQGWLVQDQNGRVIEASESSESLEPGWFTHLAPGPEHAAEWVQQQGDNTVITHVIKTDNDIIWARLYLVLQGNIDEALELSRFIRDSLNHEIALLYELNSMATELSDRYEELHLIYDIDTQPLGYEKSQSAINQLVKGCVDYLSVDFAYLWLPRQKIEIAQGADQAKRDEFQYAMSGCRQYFLDHVTASGEAFVVNSFDELARHCCDCELPYKITICPIKSQEKNCIGFLMLAKMMNRNDFTNSDRKLLRAMAGKVTKAILSIYDDKTGLVKHEGFAHQLQRALQAKQNQSFHHSLILVNIDKFSVINDVMGFDEGDKLLLRVTHILNACIRNSDTLSRLTGNTFALLLPNCSMQHAQKIGQKIIEDIGNLSVTNGEQHQNISCRVALSGIKHENQSVDRLLSSLNIALDIAREQGGNRLQICSQYNTEQTSRSEAMRWIGRIQEALRSNRFVPYYQPIVPLQPDNTEESHGEILLRYIDDTGAVIAPGAFMFAAEHYHLMPAIDLRVIELVLEQLPLDTPGLWSINLSGQSISEPDFVKKIVNRINAHGINPKRLCFEVTETTAIRSLTDAQLFIAELREMGCRISLDDFGTGLSSFSYLRELEIDYLKIDGSFIRAMAQDPTAHIMVKAIHKVGQSMGLKTIAEFVETDDLRQQLVDIGVDYGQGYLFSKPIPLADFLKQGY